MNNLGNKKTMADNLAYYMEEKNVTRVDVCRDLSLKYTTLTGWLTAKKYPRIDKIELLAHYFGITKADLVEERTYQKPPATNSDGQVEKLADALRKTGVDVDNLTDSRIDQIARMAKIALEE